MPRVIIDGDRVRITGVRNFEYSGKDDFKGDTNSAKYHSRISPRQIFSYPTSWFDRWLIHF
jgi:hypothetical protein